MQGATYDLWAHRATCGADGVPNTLASKLRAPRFVATAAHVRIDETPSRRAASTDAIDARLTVWARATREAVAHRKTALVEGALLYLEKVGRLGEDLAPLVIEPCGALLAFDEAPLVPLAGMLLPDAVTHSARLLWINPALVEQRLSAVLQAHLDAARVEVRRRHAMYRRRARLWRALPARLERLREDVEGLRVPRWGPGAAERVARGLLQRHSDAGGLRPGAVARWIAQLDKRANR